jgi:hypothetical protein
VHLPGDPRVDLAILAEDPFGADQTGGVEDDARPALVALEEAPGLDVDPVLPRLLDVALGVLVGDRQGELVEQLAGGGVDRRRVRELGEDHQLDRQEGGVALDRLGDHRQHAVGVGLDAAAVGGVAEVGLAGGGGVAESPIHGGHDIPAWTAARPVVKMLRYFG